MPDWYPEWITSYVLLAMSPAVFVVIGVLAAAAVLAYVRGSPFSSESTAVETEDVLS